MIFLGEESCVENMGQKGTGNEFSNFFEQMAH